MYTRTIGKVAATGLLLVAITSACQTVEEQRRYSFRIYNDTLYRGIQDFELYGIEVPGFASLGAEDQFKIILRAAVAGASAICFEAPGAAGGAALTPEEVAGVTGALDQILERRLGGIIRVLPPGIANDKAAHLQCAKNVASALSHEERAVYWIDGPYAAEAAQAFRAAAPDVIVAAPANGHIKTVNEVPADAKSPVMVLGTALKSENLNIHFLMPPGDESFAAIEEAMKLDVERKPWTPDNSILSEQERAEGFIALFDGKTFDGWAITGKVKDGFRVRDGMIEWVKRGGAYVRTRDRYSDFVLRIEAQVEDGGNTGIFIRAPREGRWSKMGMEVQLMGDYGTPPHKNGTGAIYDVLPPSVNASKPAGQWNDFEITAQGDHVKVVLNGQLVQDFDMNDHPLLKNRLREGYIALQDHGRQAAFRNIRLKKL